MFLDKMPVLLFMLDKNYKNNFHRNFVFKNVVLNTSQDDIYLGEKLGSSSCLCD